MEVTLSDSFGARVVIKWLRNFKNEFLDYNCNSTYLEKLMIYVFVCALRELNSICV